MQVPAVFIDISLEDQVIYYLNIVYVNITYILVML